MRSKGKPKCGLERVAFNRKAKQLRADDNLPVLAELAEGQLFPRVGPNHPALELRQALVAAAVEAANAWWAGGGNCWRMVDKAIKAAGRTYRATGGAAADVAWRGAYSPSTRQFTSQPPQLRIKRGESMEAFHARERVAFERYTEALKVWQAATGEIDLATEEPAPEEAENLNGTDTNAATVNAIAGARNASAGAAERIDHTGQDDGERLNPHDDGEAGYGVDGASRGLFSGRIYVTDRETAQCEASARLYVRDRRAWDLLDAIYKAGTYSSRQESFIWHIDNYISKDVGRKRRRAEIIRAAQAAAREHIRLAREVMVEIKAGTFPPPEPELERADPPASRIRQPAPPPVDAVAAEQAALLATWVRDWQAANATWVKVLPLPVYGTAPWQTIARRQWKRRKWLVGAQRFRGWGLVVRLPDVSLID